MCLYIDMLCWQQNLVGLYASKHHLRGITLCCDKVWKILNPHSDLLWTLWCITFYTYSLSMYSVIHVEKWSDHCWKLIIFSFYSTADRVNRKTWKEGVIKEPDNDYMTHVCWADRIHYHFLYYCACCTNLTYSQ